MKNKKLFVTLVLAIALMLALAICSYAATITVYSGADSTSEATTYSGSLTLPGNTEANDTVTVYYTDDGRAWKAGETVSFTENTNLYTIECTKISTVTEYNNATGGGSYIIMNDLDFTQSGRGPINGDNCTTRVFMNGKSIKISNADGTMFQGNSQSFYILGEGYISSAWGGGISRGHCNNSKTDVTWLIGKDITVETNKDSSSVFSVWNTISSKSLTVHIYGTIIKAQSGTVGVWNLVSADSISTDYDLYIHEGSSIELLGNLVRYAASTAPTDTKIGEIIFNGGSVTLSGTDYFFYDKSSSAYNGTITINAGVFSIANATSLAEFKSAIVADKKAQDIDATSFTVVCKECAFEKTLSDFTNLTSDFTISYSCPNCGATGESTKVSAVFSTKGYSLSPDGKAISGGYSVSLDSLALYESVMGKVTYGIVIANADSFEGKSFFDADNKVNSTKAIQVEINRQYSNFDCSINFGTTSNNTLKLVICAYVIDDGGVSFIQYDKGDSVASSAISGSSFKYITLDMVVASVPVENKENLV
ncbi:MAG: hypothetical protein IKA43_01290 [Clostridia bacterium]|nr:hypothetical protein [Clostridia bacterium]